MSEERHHDFGDIGKHRIRRFAETWIIASNDKTATCR